MQGKLPLREYSNRSANITSDVYASGNRDVLGRSPAILKQISHKEKVGQRLSTSELDSLLLLKHEYYNNDFTKDNYKTKGFIQHVSIDPFFIFMWTRAAVRLFHDLCKFDSVFSDETGLVVNTTLTSQKLYFSLLRVNQ